MKISKGLLLTISVIVILVLVKVFVIGTGDDPGAGKGPKKGGGPMSVSGIVATKTNVDELIKVSGTVMSSEEVELTPEISGRITQLNLKEGTSVSKGALLVKFYDADLKAQLNKLNGQLKLQNEKSERLKKLYDIEGISKEEFDEAMNQLNTLQAEIDLVQAEISKTEIRAPFSGKIGLRYVSEGSFVNAGEKMATIQQIDELKIDFSIPGKYAGRVKPGDDISYNIEGHPETFKGVIYATEPKIDASTRSFRLRATTSNKEGKIYPGAFATIELVLNKDKGAIMIPTESVIPVLKGKKVYLSEGGLVISREVVTGIRNDTEIEVLSGLNEGDTVITTGIMFLRDGSSVNVKVEDANPAIQ